MFALNLEAQKKRNNKHCSYLKSKLVHINSYPCTKNCVHHFVYFGGGKLILKQILSQATAQPAASIFDNIF